MKVLECLALRSSDRGLHVLDQTQLPAVEEWIEIKDCDHMIDVIRRLQVRGAPLIGVAAALSLAHFVRHSLNREQWLAKALALRESRPTAVNLMNAMDRLIERIHGGADAQAIISMAEMIFEEDVNLCGLLAKHGSELIQSGQNILTHCNTGGLATAGAGTALAVIKEAARLGRSPHVWVDETRPLLQGARLTTWELEKARVPYTLICDNMASMLMAQGKVDVIFVGADRIAMNGDFANKVGTYSLAVNAFYHRVPFYVVAPRTTVDIHCSHGKDIPIELRKPEEVRGIAGSFGSITWSPQGAKTYNPAFDVTPADLVTGWIFEDGIFKLQQIRDGVLRR